LLYDAKCFNLKANLYENSTNSPTERNQFFFMGGVSTAPSYAINLIGNMPSNDAASTSIQTSSTKSVSFTLPSGDSYSLDNFVLRLSSTYDAGDVPLLTIRNNGSGTAGSTVLANFTNPTPPAVGVVADYTFTPNGSFTFQASTTYWLHLTSSAGEFNWSASFPSVTPSGIATFGQYQLDGSGSSGTFNSF
jgi:hypothetical protein